MIFLLFGMIVDQGDINIKLDLIKIPDKTIFVVFSNDSSFVMNDVSLGRFMIKKDWVELLDKDKLVV